MRLSKIKLAGFKSFVDPTTFHLNSNLVGVVGPNGCGKSNIIDAVRWVMGESSAKHLRGDSMTDVIFNGSTARKPVGQASIELIFDNSDGSLGGQYAQYNEIAVKRIVSRDGTSAYFLNGSRCRRRDITDIFLGTGLGPRSYSIIEQGMISRLIEAKPEELRIFIEEAAGISKYKERRRETENRIRHTMDNLNRLTDVREELGKQLSHLQRQAKTAEKFTILKQEERLVKGQLQALRWRTLDEQIKVQEGQISEQETQYEKYVAIVRSSEAEIEALRESQVDATEAFNEEQGRFYSVGADIARLEQNIQHTKDRRQQQQQDLTQVKQALSEAQSHLDMDQRQIAQLKAVLEETDPLLEEAEEAERLSGAAYAEAEQLMNEWQQMWESFNQRNAEFTQTAEVERTDIRHFEEQLLQLQQRSHRLEEEQSRLSTETLEQEIAQVEQQLQEIELDNARYQEELEQHIFGITQTREQNNQWSTQQDAVRSNLQRLRGRHASLEALQQAALGKRQGAVSDWLENHGLKDAQRLAQGITVESGWERAVECVLGFNLEAVCVNGIDNIIQELAELQQGSIAVFDMQAVVPQINSSLATPLLAKVSAQWRMDALLAGVYAAEDLNEALTLRQQLAAHESVVTRDGIWLGSSWLRVAKDADEKAGVLQREQELREIVDQIAELETEEVTLKQKLEEGRHHLSHLEETRESAQGEINRINRQRADIQSELSGKKARLEQINSRTKRIQEEIQEIQLQVQQNSSALGVARNKLQDVIDQLEALSHQREDLIVQRDHHKELLEQARQKARVDRDAAHEVALKIQSTRTGLQSTQQSLERIEKQLGQFVERRDTLHQAIEDSEAPLKEMAEELEQLLTSRMEVEAALNEARHHVEEIDHKLREFSSERNKAEQNAQTIRAQLDKARMAWQEIRVRNQTLLEQIAESGFTLQALFEEMPEGAVIDAWQENLENITQRIQRLGPINLAAIDEYKEQSERKAYLDAQNDDLSQALQTLENAIQKIDRETRARFRETYDKINDSFKERFPKLFGGGQAYLELTGEDLLDTGVTVMARPPGKRNSTIHLLSGGEKALTAIALVFAIFELNPAPFCMLDEVDAPLDDANVGRYCNVVKEMSDHVQFIFITHNKVTMEMAHQINGVTMLEAGVSRLVAVDVDEAAKLAAM